jgi:hypothetical protein
MSNKQFTETLNVFPALARNLFLANRHAFGISYPAGQQPLAIWHLGVQTPV